MFQFENKEYERILKSSRRRGKFAKDCEKLLADLRECLEGLTLHEVDFLLTLRRCDKTLRLELLEALMLWCGNRTKFHEKLAKLRENAPFIAAAERLARE